MDWLEEFGEYASDGEASPRLMFWVGVSTIAAALQRKVWYMHGRVPWSPNFYILVVGAAGVVRKSTSIDVGMELAGRVDGIEIGADIATWQAFLADMADRVTTATITDSDGCIEYFEHCSITLPMSEFGNFFRPEEGQLVDSLTSIWDNRPTLTKITKTSGNDTLQHPWLNIIAGTTPTWLATNFRADLVGSGWAGRCIYLYEDMPPTDVPYPTPDEARIPGLVQGLKRMHQYAGPMQLTNEAKEWGTEWYKQERAAIRLNGTDGTDSGFANRKQCHMHKLAMVLSAARSRFPVIGLQELMDANAQLSALNVDVERIFGFVGQNPITSAVRELAAAVKRSGKVGRGVLYHRQFVRTLNADQFELVVRSAVAAELIIEVTGAEAQPYFILRD